MMLTTPRKRALRIAVLAFGGLGGVAHGGAADTAYEINWSAAPATVAPVAMELYRAEVGGGRFEIGATAKSDDARGLPLAMNLATTNLGDANLGGANLDNLISSYQSQGLQIDSLISAWDTAAGRLSAGKARSNFAAEFDASAAMSNARPTNAAPLLGNLGDNRGANTPTAAQIGWRGQNGLSIALEQAAAGDAVDDETASLQALTADTPSLIVTWRDQVGEGQYQLAGIGRKLAVKGVHNDAEIDDRELGWGVKLSGGWRFRDWFAALSVTLGDGIDTLISNRFGRDIAVSPSGDARPRESLHIMPKLSYQLGDSDFHLSLGHYHAGGELGGVDTLDSINLGYSWSPWPSMQFGVEVIGRDYDGALDIDDSIEIKFGAQTQF